MNRELIYSTLFDLWRRVDGLKTVSRRLKDFSEVPMESQPALFQLQVNERQQWQKGLPKKNTLSLDLFIYTASLDDTIAPSSLLNPILDAIDEILTPDPSTGYFDMGIDGVSHCWIDGETKLVEGVLDNQAIAIVPISILTAG